MARRRMIHPAIWSNRQVGGLPRDERLLFLGVVSLADDYGKLVGEPSVLRGALFPFDKDMTDEDVLGMLKNLRRARLILLWQAGGRWYIQLPTWQRWQKVEHPTPSDLPNCPKKSVWVRSENAFVPTQRLDRNLNVIKGSEEPDSGKVPENVVNDSPVEEERGEEREEKKKEEEVKRKGTGEGEDGASEEKAGAASLGGRDGPAFVNNKTNIFESAFDALVDTVPGLDRKAKAHALRQMQYIDLRNGGAEAVKRLAESARDTENPSAYVVAGIDRVSREHPK